MSSCLSFVSNTSICVVKEKIISTSPVDLVPKVLYLKDPYQPIFLLADLLFYSRGMSGPDNMANFILRDPGAVSRAGRNVKNVGKELVEESCR